MRQNALGLRLREGAAELREAVREQTQPDLRSARLRLVLSENAFLLVVGLLVGCGCALLGVLPSIVSSGRTVNFTALSLTLAAVLVIGLGALTLAVWFGQRRITPADLRAE